MVKRFIFPIILLFVLLLRIPSFFEPYWYGDEGIYLAIGQAMQRGAVLYRDIWDNKPPLLYLIYAIVPTLIWAKLTATICVLGTSFFIYKLTKLITKGDCLALLAMTSTGVLLSLPLLEGTIANAELYFTLPIIIAAYIVIARNVMTKQSLLLGFLFTAAFLIKIPAVFDFLGMFLAYFIITRKIRPFVLIFLTFAVSFFFILSYFFFNHALSDFLTASFSQNASYVAVGSGPLSKLSNPLFIKALFLLLSLFSLSILFVKKKISRELLFLIFWFGFSLYGALLSNRPYLHYLLQIVPPAVVLFFYLISHSGKVEGRIQNLSLLGVFIFILLLVVRMFTGAFALDTRSYYTNFFDYVSERKTWDDYANYFDGRTTNNYAIGNYLATRTSPLEPIFFWGDNAFIYVLSNRPPVTKFIQAHHLTTIPAKNYDSVMGRLNKYQPKFIIVSRPAHFPFPALEAFISKNYRLVNVFTDMYVYQNTLPANSPPFDPHYSN